MGITLYQIGRLDQAAEKLKQSYQIYQSLGDKQNEALVLMELGITSKIAGSYQDALSYYEAGLNIWRDTKNLIGQANLLNNLAVLRHLVGDYDRAGILYEEGLEDASLSGYTRMQAYILCGMGDLYNDIGAKEAAQDAFKRSAQLANESQEGFLQTYLLIKDGSLARIAGNYDLALEIMEKVKKILSASGSFYEIGLGELELGHLNSALGNYEIAIEYYQRAGDHFNSAGQRADAVRAHFYLAGSYLKNKNHILAENALRESFALSSTLDTQYFLVTAGIENLDLLRAFNNHPGFEQQINTINELISIFQERIPSIRKQLRPYATSIQFIQPELTIYALGLSQVKVDGKVVNANEWQSQRRVREFFYYLLEHPEGLTKEEIGVVLWPESSSSQMKLQFKNSLYRLRYALGQEVISLVEERYFFNRSLDFVYDVEEFVKAITDAQALKDSKHKIEALKHAVSFYRGNYLVDFDSIWLLNVRERLWKYYADAILTLARLHLEAGENQLALDYSQRLINEDPCQEEAHQVAMGAFAALGDRASVIRQFESCRQSLMNEIKAKPSQKTNQLYKSLIK
jgi:two-component SAPR family response regulator